MTTDEAERRRRVWYFGSAYRVRWRREDAEEFTRAGKVYINDKGGTPMFGRIIVVGVLAALAGACVKEIPPKQLTPEDAHFNVPPDQLWQALTIIYTDLNIPIENMDRASWFLRSGDVVSRAGKENAELFDCGQHRDLQSTRGEIVQRSIDLDVHSSITTLLIPAADGTDVRTRVNSLGTPFGGLARYDCYSTGKLEGRVIDALRERLSTTR